MENVDEHFFIKVEVKKVRRHVATGARDKAVTEREVIDILSANTKAETIEHAVRKAKAILDIELGQE